MSWLLYYQNFLISIYHSRILEYWRSSNLFHWNGMWLNLVLSNQYQFLIIMFYNKKTNNTMFSIRTIINGNVNIIFYYSKDVDPPCLWYILNNDYNTMSPLHVPMKDHDNIMDENNWRETIEFEISVSIWTQDTTYDYNDEFGLLFKLFGFQFCHINYSNCLVLFL